MAQFYPKIHTLYKRDEKTKKIIVGDYSRPEFEILKDVKWDATYKTDGTNISICFDGKTVQFRGKTDRADIPKHLLKKLQEIFTLELLNNVFTEEQGTDGNINPRYIEIFGEGYGMKIQKGGNYIPDGVDFILFDVRIGKWWLDYETCEKIAQSLGTKIVPSYGKLTIKQAEEMVIKGFKSPIAHNKDYEAEGLVLRAPLGLLDRSGNRIITKIKHVDYKHLS